MKSKFLNLKEFVLVIVLSCLMIGIGYLIMLPFAANMQLLYFLEPGLIGLVNGIVYVLMIRKCPKIGTQFIIAALYGGRTRPGPGTRRWTSSPGPGRCPRR